MITRDDLPRLLGVAYTDDQLDAITAPSEPMLIVAGAGSGKTAVMAARVVWLVGTGDVAPESVLGLTFTNKAAASLAARVSRALETAGLIDHADPGPVVSTYHSFAGQVITDHGLLVGVEPHARIITDAARAQLALRVLRQTRLPLTAITGRPASWVGPLLRLDDALAEQGLEPEVLAVHDSDLIAEIAALPKPTKPVLAIADVARQRIELGQLVQEFRAAKRAADLVDFADQIRLALDIVRTQPAAVASLRERHQAVLLDEYQDTSVAQRLFLSAAFGQAHNLTAVGDPLQAIYGWRGASVDNIDSFPVHFPLADGSRAHELSLAANMRSGIRILEAANEVAAPLRSVHPAVRPLTQGNPSRGSGHVRVALHSTWSDELGFVVDTVASQLHAGAAPDDIAVLARRGSQLSDLDAALGAAGIPTTIADLDGLLAVPEIVDIVSTLEVLADATSNIALLRLLTGPRWNFGHRDLAYLAHRAKAIASGHAIALTDDATLAEAVASKLITDPVDVAALLDALEDPGDAPISVEARNRAEHFTAELRYLRRFTDEPLHDLISRVAAVSGLDLELASSPTLVARNRTAVVSSFIDLAANFASLDGEASLESFLAWLQAGDDLGAVPQLSIPPAPGSVVLLTVHRAKGLEWPVVLIPGVCDSVFPNKTGLDRYTTKPYALPHVLRADGAALPREPELHTKGLERFDDDMKLHSLREELRLGYVATTRAEQLLVVSGHWWGPTQKTLRGPSQILLDVAEAVRNGAGEVVVWAERPGEDATNPALDDTVVVPYESEAESDEARARRELARAVLSAIDERRHDPEAADAAIAATGAELNEPQATLLAEIDADTESIITRLLAARSAERIVELPSSLTASQVQSLAADPDGFTKRLARPMPTPPRPAAARGSEFHRALEQRFAAAALIDLDDLAGAGDPERSEVDVSELLAAFDASPWALRTPRAIEWPFAVTVAGRLIRGRVDAIFPGGAVPTSEVPLADGLDPADSVVLVDWKTSRPGGADPLQLAVYRHAWATAHGIDPRLVRVCFVHWPSGVVVAPTEIATATDLMALLAPSS